jgi:hypothetical protein
MIHGTDIDLISRICLREDTLDSYIDRMDVVEVGRHTKSL